MPEAQLGDLLRGLLHVGENLTEQSARLGQARAIGVRGVARRIVRGRAGPGLTRAGRMAAARFPRGGVQAGTQLAFLRGALLPGRAAGERLDQGIDGLRGIRHQPVAVAVQRCRVLVVGGSQPVRTRLGAGRDHRAVIHQRTIVESSALACHGQLELRTWTVRAGPGSPSDPVLTRPFRCYRFPRRACSRSIASNSALKFPLPNPSEPCRSISSKNTVGRSCTGWVKICSR